MGKILHNVDQRRTILIKAGGEGRLKKLFIVVAVIALFLQFTAQSFAYVSVSGYYRSNGTYVRPYVRSDPNGIRYDNYGYTGGSSYNNSYYDSGYSSNWYKPSYSTDSNYYYGRSLYNSYRSSYSWDY